MGECGLLIAETAADISESYDDMLKVLSNVEISKKVRSLLGRDGRNVVQEKGKPCSARDVEV